MANKNFIICKEEDGIIWYYEYTSMVGVTVCGTDISKAKVFRNGNDMRRRKNLLNKEKNLWKSKDIQAHNLHAT